MADTGDKMEEELLENMMGKGIDDLVDKNIDIVTLQAQANRIRQNEREERLREKGVLKGKGKKGGKGGGNMTLNNM